MSEKPITVMNEEEILAHIAQQRLQREQRHAEAVALKERKGKQKVTKDTIDNAFDELIKAMLAPPGEAQ